MAIGKAPTRYIEHCGKRCTRLTKSEHYSYSLQIRKMLLCHENIQKCFVGRSIAIYCTKWLILMKLLLQYQTHILFYSQFQCIFFPYSSHILTTSPHTYTHRAVNLSESLLSVFNSTHRKAFTFSTHFRCKWKMFFLNKFDQSNRFDPTLIRGTSFEQLVW